MFKGWFIDSYPECKDYLDLTYFDVEKNTFLSKCSYNPDSGNAAKVLKIAFGSWQHQQAKVEELQKRVEAALELMQKPVIVGEPAKYVCARFKEIEQALKGEGCQ
ncbi:hypothetical protein M214_2798 [Acinetobacter baumannii CI86]|nr:hypothetical protein M214_2798 [Acinetobacter baumannii CI86]ETR85876.1 hypothetical protein M212_2819 [Acinetobacter baumannii CI79]